MPTHQESPAGAPPTWRMRVAHVLTARPFLRAGFATGLWRPVGAPAFRAWLSYHSAFVEDLDRAFRRAWSPRGWQKAFENAARHRIEHARSARASGARRTAVRHQAAAAIYAQIAPYFTVHDKPTRERFLRWSAELYRSAVAVPGSRVTPVSIPFRGGFEMPGYLHMPPFTRRPPVVVVTNALEHYKEVWHMVARRLTRRGVAALTFDAPGEGEMWPFTVMPLRYADVGSAVLDFLQSREDVDASRPGVLGISVGGTMAALAAASDERWGACAAVSPAFNATNYVGSLPPNLIETLQQTLGESDLDGLRAAAPHFSLANGVASRITCPLAVVRAGKDTLVPPEDATRLLDAASSRVKRLYEFPDANHAGVEHFHDAMDEVLDFLAEELTSASPEPRALEERQARA